MGPEYSYIRETCHLCVSSPLLKCVLVLPVALAMAVEPPERGFGGPAM